MDTHCGDGPRAEFLEAQLLGNMYSMKPFRRQEAQYNLGVKLLEAKAENSSQQRPAEPPAVGTDKVHLDRVSRPIGEGEASHHLAINLTTKEVGGFAKRGAGGTEQFKEGIVHKHLPSDRPSRTPAGTSA